MADLFQVGVRGGSQTDLTVSDVTGLGPGDGTNLSTGDLRRKYNFGDRVSELSLAQDPFFRFLSKVSKKPTDDPSFKWAEKRPSYHKRYAYVMGFKDNAGTASFTNGLATSASSSNTGSDIAAGETLHLYMAGDWKSDGNQQNIYGNTDNDWTVGASGTTPKFFLPGQMIKIPMATADASATTSWGSDYILARITEVVAEHSGTAVDSKYPTEIKATVVKATSSSYLDFAGFFAGNNFAPGGAAGDEVVADVSISGTLEKCRTYIVGSAFAEGSGYPETWKDQPYATNYGLTQIWKTSMAMTNTARATSLKYESNEWARVWKEKLVEHKWDIETSLLFGRQYEDSDNGIQYTQGAVDYITQYGNQFSLDTSTKSSDDFLDDMSNLLDPRYNDSSATVFFVSTAVYNWMHKLGGYIHNTMAKGINSNAAMYTADIAITGKKKVLGVDITTFNTPYGDMNVARNIHLDGTQVKMLGINLKYCAYRPLVGNGLNRDTSVYVGVQTLENSGVDRRVDLILTEAGMEFSMPECHAIWT